MRLQAYDYAARGGDDGSERSQGPTGLTLGVLLSIPLWAGIIALGYWFIS